MPAKVVSEMLGHSRIDITLNFYSHVTPNLQEEATGRLSKLLVSLVVART